MQDLKISVITITYNAESTITNCIESVIRQNYRNVEYIIIDGGSKDKTLSIIDQYRDHINILVTEPDKGIYDAMNKGIRMAGGEVVGTLNADDFFTDDTVLSSVAEDHGTAADYELMLRFIHLNKIDAFYIKKVMNKMNTGGVSNKSYSNRVQGLLFDYKAMRNNGILLPVVALILKPLRKITQYF